MARTEPILSMYGQSELFNYLYISNNSSLLRWRAFFKGTFGWPFVTMFNCLIACQMKAKRLNIKALKSLPLVGIKDV